MQYAYRIEYYSAFKKKETSPFDAVWMNLGLLFCVK
jgi:hypothetical protein